MYTSGPDLTSIMPCKYGKPSGIFTKFVTEDSLRSEHVRDLFLKNNDLDTAALVVSTKMRDHSFLSERAPVKGCVCVFVIHKYESGRPVYCFISRWMINVLF